MCSLSKKQNMESARGPAHVFRVTYISAFDRQHARKSVSRKFRMSKLRIFTCQQLVKKTLRIPEQTKHFWDKNISEIVLKAAVVGLPRLHQNAGESQKRLDQNSKTQTVRFKKF